MTDHNKAKIYPDSDLLRLDNQLCFALYVTSKEIIKKYKPLLKPYKLTYTGYIVMLALWESDNINVKDLGKKLYLDSGTLTPLLKKLESKQLIERRRSTTDERNVYIFLSEKGRKMQEDAVEIPKGLMCSLNLGDVDGRGLLQTLHKIMPQL